MCSIATNIDNDWFLTLEPNLKTMTTDELIDWKLVPSKRHYKLDAMHRKVCVAKKALDTCDTTPEKTKELVRKFYADTYNPLHTVVANATEWQKNSLSLLAPFTDMCIQKKPGFQSLSAQSTNDALSVK